MAGQIFDVPPGWSISPIIDKTCKLGHVFAVLDLCAQAATIEG